MADLDHLEKMGRELKCPICWSLLKSAVSLSCNHVFCDLCIKESMKTMSDCPVCKVPFHRREVRPAAHMDNLVNIYKNMESAAGVNIFCTQITPQVNNSDGCALNKKQRSAPQATEVHQKKSRRKSSSKQTKRNMETVTPQNSDRCLSREPSFPGKKRVQVTPFPISETPVRPQKMSRLADQGNTFTDDRQSEERKNLVTDSHEKQSLEPFFWLREDDNEDEDMSTSQQLPGTPGSQKVPSFSDLKDPEVESPNQNTPSSTFNAAKLLDSEMFEWTQIPCSPELRSKTLKKQSTAKLRQFKIQEDTCNEENKVDAASSNVVRKNTEFAPADVRKKSHVKNKSKKNSGSVKTRSLMRITQKLMSTDVGGTVLDNCGEVAVTASQENENTQRKTPPSPGKGTTIVSESPVTILEKDHQEAPCGQINNSVGAESTGKDRTILRKCKNINCGIKCAFCHSSDVTQVSGDMMHYSNGTPVVADFNEGVNVIHAHKHCTEWAPEVYFEDDLAVNLAVELARSRRIKCCCCGINGAALGCYEKSCRKSFHFTCAKMISECQWDSENFVMLCPLHSSQKLPVETPKPSRQSRKKHTLESKTPQMNKSQLDLSQEWRWPSGSHCKWVLCGSALSAAEKEVLSKFVKLTGVTISTSWSPEVSHVIASTYENGACKRTIKILKAILYGKWILNFNWVRDCMEAMKHLDEKKYEITVDVHGIRDGPRLGRMKAMNEHPKLFQGFDFYFSGDYASDYKRYLKDLAITAGGAVLQRKPIPKDQDRLLGDTSTSKTFIVYSLECPENCSPSNAASVVSQRQAKARALADASGGAVVSNAWILNSIAGCKLQPL